MSTVASSEGVLESSYVSDMQIINFGINFNEKHFSITVSRYKLYFNDGNK